MVGECHIVVFCVVFGCHVVEFYLSVGCPVGWFNILLGCHIVGLLPWTVFVDFCEEKEEEEENVERKEDCVGTSHHYQS